MWLVGWSAVLCLGRIAKANGINDELFFFFGEVTISALPGCWISMPRKRFGFDVWARIGDQSL